MSHQSIAYHPEHNHSHCIEQALAQARELCKARKQRLTAIRELVLRLIWQSHQPLGAYDLLPALAEAGFNSAPPTVYRALDFLQTQGLVHRIASLNAFVGCPSPEHAHDGCFLICENCRTVVELDAGSIINQVQTEAQALGFAVRQQTIEISGLCPNCQNPGQSSDS
ncbi:MAG: transcriptional repressor [Marinobacterium sp.]|nr:transcriptional repressor [Marinobacterium sp.]